MFNSTGNNFGAGTIQFKDYQASNYIVLNAKFTVDTTTAAYKAASQLEITVPDLALERSALAAVAVRFVDRRTLYGYDLNYDGGTIAKSWIKDKNTIVIEKISEFDEKAELIIYIQSLYASLNQGSNAIKSTKTKLTSTQETTYLYWNSESFCAIFEKWVFVYLHFRSCSYAYRESAWECTFAALPSGLDVDVPFFGGGNQMNPAVNGCGEAHIEGTTFTMEERVSGFQDTSYDPFIYAFLIRDEEEESEEEETE